MATEDDKTVNAANLAKHGKVGALIAIVVLVVTMFFPVAGARIASIASWVVPLLPTTWNFTVPGPVEIPVPEPVDNSSGS